MTTCRALGCAMRVHALALFCPKHQRMVPPELLEGALRPGPGFPGLAYLTTEQVDAAVAAVAMAELEARQAPKAEQLELVVGRARGWGKTHAATVAASAAAGVELDPYPDPGAEHNAPPFGVAHDPVVPLELPDPYDEDPDGP